MEGKEETGSKDEAIAGAVSGTKTESGSGTTGEPPKPAQTPSPRHKGHKGARSRSRKGPGSSAGRESTAAGTCNGTEAGASPASGAGAVAIAESPRQRRAKKDPSYRYNEDNPLKVIVTGYIIPRDIDMSDDYAELNSFLAHSQHMFPAGGVSTLSWFPPYSQPHDLSRTFGRFGAVNVDALTGRFAALSFGTEDIALAALQASGTLHVYGEFLQVRPYSRQRITQLCARVQPRPDVFPRSKQKEQIIEPKDLDYSGTFEEQLDRLLARVRLTHEQVSRITSLYTDVEHALQAVWPDMSKKLRIGPQVSRITSLYTDVEHALQAVWPGCVAIPFGSIPAGLGVQWSDADCFVLLPPEPRSQDHVRRAKRRLEDFKQVFVEIIAIPQANTPIVKFFHLPTGTNCDLSFKTPLGARNTSLIAALLRSDPRLLPVAVLLKYWGRSRHLTGCGRLSSYALTLLLVAYLQVIGALPAVRALQAGRPPALVDHWDAGFGAPRVALDPSATPRDLIGGFFRYYAAFDFEALVVCPYLGRPVRRELFLHADRLPAEFERYRDNVAAGRVMPLRHGTAFVVQDPFEQSVNVASAIGARFAAEIRALVRLAAQQYAAGEAERWRRFLPALLLAPAPPPPPPPSRGPPEYRVDHRGRGADPAWRLAVRAAVLIIFEKMLRVELGKVEEQVEPEPKQVCEKFAGVLTKAIWRRRPSAAVVPGLDLQERQARITDDILRTDRRTWNIRFQLTLAFRPQGAAVSVRLVTGDRFGFREFGRFFVSIMAVWFWSLLHRCLRLPGAAADADVPDCSVDNDSDGETMVSVIVNNSTLASKGDD